MLIVLAVGLCIGSFLNVVILRSFSGESIVLPPSKCPSCKTKLNWYENIPVFSFLFLRGKCKSCSVKISPQYPSVEAITGLLFLFAFMIFGATLNTLFLWVLISFFVLITVTDLKEQVVFDIHTYPVILLGLVYNFFDIGQSELGTREIMLSGIGQSITLNESFISAFIAMVAGALFFEVVARLGILLVGTRAFGEGDTIITAGLGAFFGFQNLIMIIILSFLIQVVVGVPVIVAKMIKAKDTKSLVAMGLLLSCLFMPKISSLIGLDKTFVGSLIMLIVIFIIAGYGCVTILKSAKQVENRTYLPFGPALIFGALAVIFFGNQLISLGV